MPLFLYLFFPFIAFLIGTDHPLLTDIPFPAANTDIPRPSNVISIIDERYSRITLNKIYLVKTNTSTGNIDVTWRELSWISLTPGGTEALESWKLYRRNIRASRRKDTPLVAQVNALSTPVHTLSNIYSYYLF